MIRLKFILFFFITCSAGLKAQNNTIKINASFDFGTSEFQILQQTTFVNQSNQNIDTLYFHNWANSFRNRRSPLSRRLIEDYDKSLYFSSRKNRGRSAIKAISENYKFLEWNVPNDSPDIIKVALSKTLQPKDSTIISATYIIKIPQDKFTKYGKNGTTYNLRYWHLVPAVYDGKWHTMNNLNMDDFYMTPTNYDIELRLPDGVTLNSDLDVESVTSPPITTHKLTGKNRVDIELNINFFNDFKTLKTEALEVISNLNGTTLNNQVKTDVVNRQLAFIQKHLGRYPHKKILINKISYYKNPIYGLNQLPKMFNPFSGVFEWDIKMFKVLTKKYIENTLIVNRRKDYWFVDGLHHIKQ